MCMLLGQDMKISTQVKRELFPKEETPCKQPAEDQGITRETMVEPDTPCEIMLDPYMVDQAMVAARHDNCDRIDFRFSSQGHGCVYD